MIQRRSNRAFVDSANSTLPSFCFPFPSFVSVKQQNVHAAIMDYLTQAKPLCDGNKTDVAGPAHPRCCDRTSQLHRLLSGQDC